jgi:hypothetical protein
MDYARRIVHPQRREQREVMVYRVDEAHPRRHELVVAELAERFAPDRAVGETLFRA